MSAVREVVDIDAGASARRRKAPSIDGAPSAYNEALRGGYFMLPLGWMQQLLAKRRATTNQLAAIIVIASRTIAAPRQEEEPAPEWGVVKMAEFAAMMGLDSERGAQRVIDDLLDRHLIAGEKRGRDMVYKLLPENFKNAKLYEPRTGQPVRKPVESAAAAAPAPALRAALVAEDAAPAGADPALLVVLPGQESPPLTLGESVRRVRWRNCGEAPVELAWSAAGGELAVGVQAVKQTNTGPYGPVSDAGRCSAQNGVVRQTNTGPYGPVSTQPIENERRLLLEGCLLPLFVGHFGEAEPLTDELLDDIDRALGAAPVELFIQRVRKRFTTRMSRPRHLIPVAAEVRDHHSKLQKHNEIAERERAAADAAGAARAAELLATAREELRSGACSASEHAMYLRWWPELADEFPLSSISWD